jgi:beta-barrel assembly-enhancing protease
VTRNRGQNLARIGTILAVALLVVALSLPLWSGLLARFLPRSIQVSIGDSLVSSLAQDSFCRSDEGLAALDEVVRQLAAAAGTDEEFQVYVVDADVLNAFAAPGGRIVLFRAIIEKSDDPGEVAGVLSHEMAHVIEGHPSKAIVEALGYGVFGLLNPGADTVGSEAAQAIMTNHYSRSDELDADRVGVEMLNTAGYDSRGLLTFFARLDAEGGQIPGALEFLSTHPTGERRAAALEKLVRDGKPVMTAEAWAALRNVCKDKGAPRASSELR